MAILKYLKLPFHFDTARLRSELESLTGALWQSHYQTKHYDGDWSAIPLRSIDGSVENILIAPTDDVVYRDTEYLFSTSYYKDVLDKFECPLKSVRLLRLGAGAVIHQHVDAELNFEKGEVRFHIPVVTNPGVEFILGGDRITMQEGECWYLNFNLPHSIANTGNEDRVHLVIDAVVNDWIKDLFNREGLERKEIPLYDPKTKAAIIANLRLLNTEVSNRLADEMEVAE